MLILTVIHGFSCCAISYQEITKKDTISYHVKPRNMCQISRTFVNFHEKWSELISHRLAGMDRESAHPLQLHALK